MKPNDGHCHLSTGGIYTEAENQVCKPDTEAVIQICKQTLKLRNRLVNKH